MKGIKFNSEMVNAILEGGKTQTRRVVPSLRELNSINVEERCVYGEVGDKFFVKEDVWNSDGDFNYSADDKLANYDEKFREKYSSWGVVPAHYIKQEQSRIILEITDIRVERLKNISEGDAIKEGYKVDLSTPYSLFDLFKLDWDLKNRSHPIKSWGANPFVWVIDFKVVK